MLVEPFGVAARPRTTCAPGSVGPSSLPHAATSATAAMAANTPLMRIRIDPLRWSSVLVKAAPRGRAGRVKATDVVVGNRQRRRHEHGHACSAIQLHARAGRRVRRGSTRERPFPASSRYGESSRFFRSKRSVRAVEQERPEREIEHVARQVHDIRQRARTGRGDPLADAVEQQRRARAATAARCRSAPC